MKTSKFFLITLVIVMMGFSHSSTLTNAERKYARNLLTETKEVLLMKIKGLTAEQLNFKVNDDSWSIAECVEHIAISENNFMGFVQMSLKEEADPAKRSELKMTDEAIIKMITDRSNKIKTSSPFQPSGKFGSFEASLNEFSSKRDRNIHYIRTTSDDLRNHFNDFPFGKLDAFQIILFMSGHTKRHTDQIEEIIHHANFPKNVK